MNTYAITIDTGTVHEVAAASIPDALRTLRETVSFQSVVSIQPAILKRAADQQA